MLLFCCVFVKTSCFCNPLYITLIQNIIIRCSLFQLHVYVVLCQCIDFITEYNTIHVILYFRFHLTLYLSGSLGQERFSLWMIKLFTQIQDWKLEHLRLKTMLKFCLTILNMLKSLSSKSGFLIRMKHWNHVLISPLEVEL